MRMLALIESIQNFFDCGIVVVTLKNSLKTKKNCELTYMDKAVKHNSKPPEHNLGGRFGA